MKQINIISKTIILCYGKILKLFVQYAMMYPSICHSISRKSNKDIIFLQSLHKCAIDCDEGLITLSDIEMHNYLHECSTVCVCVYVWTHELNGKHVVLIVLTGS